MTRFVALVVENDTLQREAMADALKSHALEVIECTTGEAAELVLASVAPELIALVIAIFISTAECPVLVGLGQEKGAVREEWPWLSGHHHHFEARVFVAREASEFISSTHCRGAGSVTEWLLRGVKSEIEHGACAGVRQTCVRCYARGGPSAQLSTARTKDRIWGPLEIRRRGDDEHHIGI